MSTLDVAGLLSSLRRALEPQRKPDMLVSFGRWALVQRDSLAVRAASPLAVATVALAAGFALGALFASLAASKLHAKRRAAARITASGVKQQPSAAAAAAAGAATAKVSLLIPSSLEKLPAAASTSSPSSDAAVLDARLLREASRARELAEAEASAARREAAALREEVAALETKLAASQRTRRAVAAELAAAFGLPPTPTPASAPPRSGLGGGGGGGGGERGGATAASRFFASPPPAAPSSEGRASRVAKALAAA